MVDVEMDTWFHTTYPDVERRLEDFFYDSQVEPTSHILAQNHQGSWSEIQPASIATRFVREEPTHDEAQVDLSELLAIHERLLSPSTSNTSTPRGCDCD